ncbi:hypothetical protein L1887_05800 [Cichorium endivia]|nr:hypothetical protein L1887_05800 [Cichorium endivia]
MTSEIQFVTYFTFSVWYKISTLRKQLGFHFWGLFYRLQFELFDQSIFSYRNLIGATETLSSVTIFSVFCANYKLLRDFS